MKSPSGGPDLRKIQRNNAVAEELRIQAELERFKRGARGDDSSVKTLGRNPASQTGTIIPVGSRPGFEDRAEEREKDERAIQRGGSGASAVLRKRGRVGEDRGSRRRTGFSPLGSII